MFSRNLLIIVAVALFIAINLIVITTSSRDALPVSGVERIAISVVSPFQKAVSRTIRFTTDIWDTYFLAVLAVGENVQLKNELGKSLEAKTHNDEQIF